MDTPRKGKTPGSGRKKGTPNKRTVAVQELFAKHNFDPAVALIELYQSARKAFDHYDEIYDAIIQRKLELGAHKIPTVDHGPTYLKLAMDAASDLMQYAHPKRKAIEVTDASDPKARVFTVKWADEDDKPGNSSPA